MNQKRVVVIVISLSVIIVLGMYLCNKVKTHDQENEVVLVVNSKGKYTIKAVNLMENQFIEVGNYKTKSNKIVINKSDFIDNNEPWEQFLILLENEEQVGVGLYTHFAMGYENDTIESLSRIYENKYVHPIDISLYDKKIPESYQYEINNQNIEIKTEYNEDQCIMINEGAYISKGYDENGKVIGQLFSYNSSARISMQECDTLYNNINIINNYFVSEITLSNSVNQIKFVVPIKWIPSIALDSSLQKDEYTYYELNDNLIQLEIDVFKAEDYIK